MEARLADIVEPTRTLVSSDCYAQGRAVTVEDRLARVDVEIARLVARLDDTNRRVGELEQEICGGHERLCLRSEVEQVKVRLSAEENRQIKHKDNSLRVMIAVIAAISAIVSGAIGIIDHWFRSKQ